MASSRKDIYRRAAGWFIILLAVTPCLYTILNLCYVYSTHYIYWGGTEINFSSEPYHYPLRTYLSIILWCIQFVIPALIVGHRMTIEKYVIKGWKRISLSVAALMGLYLMFLCADYQYMFVSDILHGDDSQKEIEAWPILCSGMSWYPQYIFIALNTIIFSILFKKWMKKQSQHNDKIYKTSIFITMGITIFTILSFANTHSWLMKYIGY